MKCKYCGEWLGSNELDMEHAGKCRGIEPEESKPMNNYEAMKHCIDCEKLFSKSELWYYGGYYRCMTCEDTRWKKEVEKLNIFITTETARADKAEAERDELLRVVTKLSRDYDIGNGRRMYLESVISRIKGE